MAVVALVAIAVGAAAADYRALKRWPGTVEATRLNVRSGPGQNYEIVNTLAAGDAVIVVERIGEWARVEGEGGGWVYLNFLRLPENFMEPLFGEAENEFLDWAGETGQFEEISVVATGRVAVILTAELYADPEAARAAGRAAACAYRERVQPEEPVSVVIWAAGGPAAGLIDEVSCPD